MSLIELLKVENDILRDRIAVIESDQARTGTLEEELNRLKSGNMELENQHHEREQASKLYTVEIRGVHQAGGSPLSAFSDL
jgi:cell shape-determining protein MreC